MKSDPPTLTTRINVVNLSGSNAPRSCMVCGDSAGFYAFVTDDEAVEKLPEGAEVDGWPVNAMLCERHFRDAPRVKSLAEHPKVKA